MSSQNFTSAHLDKVWIKKQLNRGHPHSLTVEGLEQFQRHSKGLRSRFYRLSSQLLQPRCPTRRASKSVSLRYSKNATICSLKAPLMQLWKAIRPKLPCKNRWRILNHKVKLGRQLRRLRLIMSVKLSSFPRKSLVWVVNCSKNL